MTNNLIQARVAARRTVAEDIIELCLERADGSPLPAYEAGAHMDVEVLPGQFRQYSLCSAADTGEHRVAILRESQGRGGSIAAHERLLVGTAVRVSAPRNHFQLLPGSQPVLLLAGGIGITPLLSMAHTLHASGRPFELFYCARSRARAAYLPEISASAWRAQAHFFFDDEPELGPFNAETELASRVDQDAQIYICGPAGFMAWATSVAKTAGFSEPSIHLEHFAAPVTQIAPDETTFELQLARAGITVQVPPDRSIAEVLEDHGVLVSLSCEAGVCGSCMTRVIEGIPDHRDTVLTQAQRLAGDCMTICCSRSSSPKLVLDL